MSKSSPCSSLKLAHSQGVAASGCSLRPVDLNRGNAFLQGHLMALRHLFGVIVGGEGMLLLDIWLQGIRVSADHPETHRSTMYKE